MWRHVPPAHSPLTLAAIRRGIQSARQPAVARQARADVIERLRLRYGASMFVFTDSGTSALSVAIAAAIGTSGKAVALPAFGCFDLATAVDAAGTAFVLYDLDPTTLGPEPSSLERALASGAGAVVVAHLYGVPVDMRMVRSLASRTHALVIDDAAQGVGGAFESIALGSGGAMGVLSFGRGKGLTGAGGGAVVLPENSLFLDELTGALGAATPTGWIRPTLTSLAQFVFSNPPLYRIPASLPFLGLGETAYRSPQPRTEIAPFSLGMLTETLPLAEAQANVRREHAEAFADAIGTGPLRVPAIPESATPGFLRFPLLLPEGWKAQSIPGALRRLGVMPSYPASLADLQGFGIRLKSPSTGCEGARTLARRLVTLPTHSGLSAADQLALTSWLKSVR